MREHNDAQKVMLVACLVLFVFLIAEVAIYSFMVERHGLLLGTLHAAALFILLDN
jgi:hypothetical protein